MMVKNRFDKNLNFVVGRKFEYVLFLNKFSYNEENLKDNL